ncbi:MAG: head GIN domain-containing protein [Bacteroidota bacterium]
MKKKMLPYLVLGFLFFALPNAHAQLKTFDVKPFEKVIVSPHIEVTLKQGDEEVVSIEDAEVPLEKINVKVEGNTLRIYLDGAKMNTKSEKIKDGNWKGRRSIYQGKMVTATITYKTLNRLSIRGEETARCESPIEQDEFDLTIYGESKVHLNSVDLQNLTVTIYGESYLEIDKGSVGRQKYTSYGESEVNTLGMKNLSTKITAYGESDFRIKVSDRLKVTCYGEAEIRYEGDPEVNKGIVIGEASIQKI